MTEINAYVCTIRFIYKLISNNYKLITISDEYATNNTSAGAFPDAEYCDYGGRCIEEGRQERNFCCRAEKKAAKAGKSLYLDGYSGISGGKQ
jgi:hypothetical protein